MAGGRRSGRIFILLALILILILALAGYFLRDQLFPQPSQPAQILPTPAPVQDLTQIIVLSQPVTRGAYITEAIIEMISYPQKDMVEGLFYTDIRNVIGKRARFDLEQGTPLTPSLLTDAPTGSYASFQVPKGKVAISIPISSLTAVAYALQPGDRVNVIGSFLLVDIDPNFQSILPNHITSVIAPGPGGLNQENATTLTALTNMGGVVSLQGKAELDPTLNQPIYAAPSEVQRPRLVSQTVVQDAIVLWVGNFPPGAQQPSTQTSQSPEDSSRSQSQEAASSPLPDIISLIVTPQDAVTLNYLLLTEARLNLTLRGSGDDQRVPTEAVTLQFLLDQYNIPSPSKLPYGIEPRVDQLAYPTLESESQGSQPQQ